MSACATITADLRVTSIRSRGVNGGAIFAGKDDAGQYFVVVADFKLIPDSQLLEFAQVWRVTGTVEARPFVDRDGRSKTESQISATALELQRPSGSALVAWIASSADCRGIGEVRARKLYERFGLELPELIEQGDVDTLTEVIDVEAAEALVAAFARHGVAETLVWLEQTGFPREIAMAVARYWGSEARAKVEANPYVLTSFCADWKAVDQLARARFGIAEGDSRRLVAAVDEVLYRGMDDGDTALDAAIAKERLQRLLGNVGLAVDALAQATIDEKVVSDDRLVQAAGLAYVEEYVATSLAKMAVGDHGEQGELFVAPIPAAAAAEGALVLYEAAHAMELTPEQRQAVLTSATSRVSLIVGGAGTGKTTVLKALCHVLARTTNGDVHQLALAGRAAQRMSQATGRPASTIASFLIGAVEVAPGDTVLIDEMSMVDVLLMYRVLRCLPAGVRLVLIGDHAQLPPIGPGLVLHALVGLAALPQTTLKVVKRQSSASGIPEVAMAVRGHHLPIWTPFKGLGAGVSVLRCDEADLDETVASVYEALGGTGSDYAVQILGATKNGHGGVKNLNRLIHERHAVRGQAVRSLHPEFGIINEQSQDGLTLFVGDLVMFGANDYELGLRNGSLGTIVKAVAAPDTSTMTCTAEFEGAVFDLNVSHLRHVLHAYSITIHKSQGSQFERVIVPIRASKLLDNALLYTAITRAVSQVVLVGDIAAAESAIRAASKATRRITRLGKALARHADQFAATRLSHLSPQLECP